MTLTFVSSFKIYTYLTAYTRVEALIDICGGTFNKDPFSGPKIINIKVIFLTTFEQHVAIHTTAGLAIDELESWCAVTLIANRQVTADVRAASIIEQAFVHI